jgi:uncharacterized protein YoaH (UPF0181 family)
MATANKSTGLQIALVFAVMASIIALVFAFLQYRHAGEVDTQLATEKTEKSKVDGELRVAQEDVKTLKELIGFPSSDVGKLQQEGDTTVVGQTRKLMAEVSTGEATTTVDATLRAATNSLNQLRTELDGQRTSNAKLSDRLASMAGEYQKNVDRHDQARKDAEKDRTEAQESKENAVKDKEKELNVRGEKIQELEATLQAKEQEAAKTQGEKDKTIARITQINKGLRAKDAEISKPSFEVPSGAVQWVDTDTNLVWIDRGSADALNKGTTFSVYKQINKGVARGLQDIKGSIEVTRIVGPHQSEARITKSKIDEPIVAGDPIYTPLWRSGMTERFALVGLIDLDNDGVSDRDVLNDLVASAHGEITDWVDDQGVRHPSNGAITVATKFLVIGKIPDFATGKPNEIEAFKKIGDLKQKMVAEAIENGVRVVSMEDFLNYMGYDAGRRIYRPGKSDKWNLHSGMEGTAARPDRNKRPESQGTTSGLFNGNRGQKMRESSGTRTPANQ